MSKRKHPKYDWAQLLYVSQGLTQKEIAEQTGVSAQTINKWAQSEKWDELRQSLLVTRDEQLKIIYMQIQELNRHIMSRDEGQRFANSKEADSLSKLTVAAKTLETESSLSDIIEVNKQLLDFLRRTGSPHVQLVAIILSDFIKDKLKR